jgi:hypothetical protein
VKRIGTLLMLAGTALWLIAFWAWISGVWVSLSPAAAKVYMLALLALSGGVLLGAGAVVSRAYRRHAVSDRERRAAAAGTSGTPY